MTALSWSLLPLPEQSQAMAVRQLARPCTRVRASHRAACVPGSPFSFVGTPTLRVCLGGAGGLPTLRASLCVDRGGPAMGAASSDLGAGEAAPTHRPKKNRCHIAIVAKPMPPTNSSRDTSQRGLSFGTRRKPTRPTAQANPPMINPCQYVTKNVRELTRPSCATLAQLSALEATRPSSRF